MRRISSKIYYYRTNSGREVYFIIQLQNRSKKLIQVCESLANEQTKKRVILALSETMAELKLSTGMIVTRDEEDEVKIDGNTIEIVPIWRFLLES